MKLIYWDAWTRPNFPFRIETPQLIKLKGLLRNIRYFTDIIEQYPRHTFLINITDYHDAEYLPENVIPVFNINRFTQLNDNFFEVFNEQTIKVVNYYGANHFRVPNKVKPDWAFVSGEYLHDTRMIVGKLVTERVPIYFEHFQFNRDYDKLPIGFQKRVIPRSVVNQVIVRSFKEHLDACAVAEEE